MAAELTYQDGHARCQGAGCGNLVYSHLARIPHLCMDCAQPVIAMMRDLRARVEKGELTSEEHNELVAAIGTADDEQLAPARTNGRAAKGDSAAASA